MQFLEGIDVAPKEWVELTRAPRTYGFHATLKAPFRLRDGADEASLLEAFTIFGTRARQIPVVDPLATLLGNFIAVVPRDADASLRRLADECVVEFDRFRAPLTPQKRARRLRSGLNAAQAANLERWGYPHVFKQFRFHMTLTRQVPPARRQALVALLANLLLRHSADGRISCDRLALMRQDRQDARFRTFHWMKLAAPKLPDVREGEPKSY